MCLARARGLSESEAADHVRGALLFAAIGVSLGSFDGFVAYRVLAGVGVLVVLAAAAVPCIAQDKYQEGYKCFQQDVVVSKGGCKGSVRGSSCADTNRAAAMQAEIGKIWFEGKSPSHCKDYFTSLCLGVGGTVKAHIPKRTLRQ